MLQCNNQFFLFLERERDDTLRWLSMVETFGHSLFFLFVFRALVSKIWAHSPSFFTIRTFQHPKTWLFLLHQHLEQVAVDYSQPRL